MAVRRRFIDIAANLTDPVFRGISWKGARLHADDFKDMMARSEAAGVDRVIVSGVSMEVSRKAIALCREYPGVLYCTVGVHPANCQEFDQSGDPREHIRQLVELVEANRDCVVAVGEIGLDYAEEKECPRDVQQRYLELQFDLAEAAGLPLFLHSRDCGLDFLEVVTRHRGRFSTGVVHSFTGSDEELRGLLDLGLSVSVNGCSLRTEEQLSRVGRIPLDRLLVETDAPWCDIRKAHAGYPVIQTHLPSCPKEKFEQGKAVVRRNEPANVIQVVEVLRAHHPTATGEGIDELAEVLYRNTMAMFWPDGQSRGEGTV